MTEKVRFFSGPPVGAYLLSVTAAAFVLSTAREIMVSPLVAMGSLNGADKSDFTGVFLFCWVLSFVGGLMPFTATILIAKIFKIKTRAYYFGCATLTGLLLGVFWLNLQPAVLLFAIAGLAAGITCWIVIRPR